jgi:hypothetical protein
MSVSDKNPLKPNQSEQFAFGKENYKFMLIGITVVILGFVLMMGGGSEDPMVFNEEIFSPRRITVAPIVALIGYGIIFYAIMKGGKTKPENQS